MNGLDHFKVIWVSLGLCLTTAIQLRFEAIPLGLGEIMLALWILFSWVIRFRNKQMHIPVVTINIAAFWFCTFLFLTLGTITAERLNIIHETLYHNFFALLFSCILCFTFLLQTNSWEFIRKVAKLTVIFTTFPLFFLYLYGLTNSMLGPIKIWYGDSEIRLQGWADNPNQLALIIVILLFISLHYLVETKNVVQRIGLLLSGILLIIVGFKTGSDAVNLTFLFFLGLLCFFVWLKQIKQTNKGYWHGAFLKIVIPLLTIVFLVLNGTSIYGMAYDSANSVFEQGDQGSMRMNLWKNGLIATLHSPFVGLGPGPYSGLGGPFQSMESHNTIIDLGTYTGFLGLAVYLALVGWIGYRAFKAKEMVLFSGIVSLVVFSLFHFVIRHPLYWFFLIMVLVECLSWQQRFERKATGHSEVTARKKILDKKGHGQIGRD